MQVNEKPSGAPMTVPEAADYLGRTPGSLYKLTHSRRIPFYKPNGGKLYFRREDLDAFAFQGRTSTDQEVQEQAESILASCSIMDRQKKDGSK